MASMRAVVLRGFGGPDALRLKMVERPQPGPGEVLVEVAGTGVNPVDHKIRNGELRFLVDEDRLPVILGRDVAGSITQVGPGVTGWAVGDAVFARPGSDRGTYADYVILRPSEMAAAPRSLPLVDAGAIPLAALTAWQGLFTAGELQRGQRVLVHGGAASDSLSGLSRR